jgi:hypothetical protein
VVTILLHVVGMMNTTKKTLAASGLLISLGACGGSDGASDRSLDGGTHADGGGTADGGSLADGTGSGADATPSDGGSTVDGHDAADGGTGAGIQAVNLGTAGNYVILAKSGISTVPTSAVTGNLGISPAAATYITGFSLTMDSTNTFSTSPQVTGSVFASDYAQPTPSNLTTAIGDMELAFTDAAGRAASVTGLGAGNIGGMTLVPGVYEWGTGLLVPTNVTLSGSSTDVWIFQIAQNLTVSNGTDVVLAGGAVAENVFWQVSGSVDLGTTSHFEGVVLSQTSITLETGASITGRLLAQTAVSIDSSAVVQPAP